MVNFGIAYGMGSFGLSDRTGMTREEAEAFIDELLRANFPGIKAWQEHMLSTTKQQGYAETLFGRRRYLPAIHSTNFQGAQRGRARGHQHAHPGDGGGHYQGGDDPDCGGSAGA